MAEPITMQKLTDASFDADTLGEFANQDKLVTSRLGAKYPSAPMASRLVVENGLLGATPFENYGAMAAGGLADGAYAVVTNDGTDSKNGVYQKVGSNYVYQKYNTLAQTKAIIDGASRDNKFINMSDGVVTLSDADSNYSMITLIQKLTANAILEMPKRSGLYVIKNSTVGGFSVTLKTVSETRGQFVLAPGEIKYFLHNGSYFEEINNKSAKSDSPVFTGNPTAPTPVYESQDKSIATTQFAKAVARGGRYFAISDTSAILSEADTSSKSLVFTGVLSGDITLTLPQATADWNIENATDGGYTISLKGAAQTNKFVDIKNGESKVVFMVASVLRSVASESAAAGSAPSYKFKGDFNYVDTYSKNDIVEHGSGRYLAVNNGASKLAPPNEQGGFYQKIGNKQDNGKSLVARSFTLEAKNSYEVPVCLTNDGLTVFNTGSQYFRKSEDYGKTWSNPAFYNFGTDRLTAWTKQLDNNELIVMVNNIGTTPWTREIHLSKGYGTDNMTFSIVKSIQKDDVTFADAWGFDSYQNIVLLNEYGGKVGEGAAVGENARYTYMSLDYGKTWKTIFDLNAYAETDKVHPHGICYDPYWQRIWYTHGDGSDAILYSDDLGDTWSYAHHVTTYNSGTQVVGIKAMPTCLLFGSDDIPNGILRIDRAEGKHTVDGKYKVQVAYKINNETVNRTHLCHAITQAKHYPNAPVLFGFGSESNPAPSIIIATYDGWTFSRLWEDSISQPKGRGIRGVVGVTVKNEVIAISNDERVVGKWSQINVKV